MKINILKNIKHTLSLLLIILITLFILPLNKLSAIQYCGAAPFMSCGVQATKVTNSTTTTWTMSTGGDYGFQVPACTSSITVQLWGAGGGGGSSAQAGGGGGQFVQSTISVTAGVIYPITVGAKGLGGAAPDFAGTFNNGSSGGNSTFNNTVIVASGGGGGTNSSGAGGNSGTGTIKYSGGNGGTGSGSYGGGGGSSAGTSSNGNNGANAISGNAPGTGGTAVTGGGAGGNGGGSGGNGSTPGGGGGGGGTIVGVHGALFGQGGGDGANGQIVITYNNPGLCSQAFASVGMTTNINPIISISSSGSILFSLTPLPSGYVQGINHDTVQVTTNDVSGYTLTISMNGASNSLISGSNYIPSTSATYFSPTALSANSWGYRIDGTGSFTGTLGSTYDTGSNTSPSPSALTFSSVPVVSSPQTIKTTSSNASNDQTIINYSVALNTTQSSGNGTQGASYTGTILYTAITN